MEVGSAWRSSLRSWERAVVQKTRIQTIHCKGNAGEMSDGQAWVHVGFPKHDDTILTNWTDLKPNKTSSCETRYLSVIEFSPQPVWIHRRWLLLFHGARLCWQGSVLVNVSLDCHVVTEVLFASVTVLFDYKCVSGMKNSRCLLYGATSTLKRNSNAFFFFFNFCCAIAGVYIPCLWQVDFHPSVLFFIFKYAFAHFLINKIFSDTFQLPSLPTLLGLVLADYNCTSRMGKPLLQGHTVGLQLCWKYPYLVVGLMVASCKACYFVSPVFCKFNWFLLVDIAWMSNRSTLCDDK